MKNKNVLVTGASRGIGRAIAIAFAEAGWSVGICCRHSAAELESLKKIIEAMGRRCFACLGDIGNYEDARAFVTGAADFLGPIDCLVNNAGISHIGLLSDMSPEEWNHIIQTNLTSVFNCCHGIIPGMVARQTGSIINISSVWGICGASCEVHYSAVKAGVIGLTKALAKEVGPSGIRVNCIAPGAIATRMNDNLDEEAVALLREETPLGRMGTPEEIAKAIAFLALEDSAFTTGQVLSPNGGLVI